MFSRDLRSSEAIKNPVFWAFFLVIFPKSKNKQRKDRVWCSLTIVTGSVSKLVSQIPSLSEPKKIQISGIFQEHYDQYWFLPVLRPRRVSTSSGNK